MMASPMRGSRNADCSAAGGGATCGDGTTCPELEFCDDGFTDACGSCNADCSAAGRVPSVVMVKRAQN